MSAFYRKLPRVEAASDFPVGQPEAEFDAFAAAYDMLVRRANFFEARLGPVDMQVKPMHGGRAVLHLVADLEPDS